MRQRFVVGLSVLLHLAGIWGDARAQNAQSLKLDLQPFHAAATADGLLTMEGTQIAAHLRPRALLQLSYQLNPLTYQAFGSEIKAVRHRLMGEFALSMGIFNRGELGVSVPVVFFQDGDGTIGPNIGVAGLGDLRLVPKFRIYGNDLSGFAAAVITGARFPTAKEDVAGGNGFGFEPQLIGAYRVKRVSLRLSTGFRIQQKRQLFNLTAGNQWMVSVGAAVRILPKLSALLEINTMTALSSPFGDAQDTPTLALIGGRYQVGDFSLSAAGGPGHGEGRGGTRRAVLADCRLFSWRYRC